MDQKSLQRHLKSCKHLVDMHKWLVDTFVLDFYVDNHWTKLPLSWRLALEEATPTDMADLLDFTLPCPKKKNWPLGILALRASAKNLSYGRRPAEKSDFLDTNKEEWSSFPAELSSAVGQHKGIRYIFGKHVKPKKQHEIARMADVTDIASERTGVRHIVDIGSGMGHLSRLLSFGHGYHVVCLDFQNSLSSTALRLDQDLLKVKQGSQPTHLTLKVDCDLDPREFEDKVENAFDCSQEFGIVGLHTCGDLGPDLIRLYNNSSKASFLQSVGCCYMHLTHKGFPMSKSASLENTDLSYMAKEMSCHALEAYIQRLRLSTDNSVVQLSVHCRRALLELALVKLGRSDLRHSCLKSIKRSHLLPFEEYALKATSNLNNINLNMEYLRSVEVQEKLSNWWHVAAFYSLRLLMAPVIETMILLDRCLYLTEQGHSVQLYPVFDPLLSPRNFILLSVKNVT